MAKYDNTVHAWETFRSHRRHYFAEIKRLKFETKSKIIQGLNETIASNPRKWWSLANKLLHNKSSSIPALDVDGRTVTGDMQKAEAFNHYFAQCSTLDDSNAELPEIYPRQTDNLIETCEARTVDVEKCLKLLNPCKAFGPDNVSPRLLKEGAEQLAPSLCMLFNVSLQTSKFPQQWKMANVIPLYKKKDKASISNYRPVSLLSSIGKVMERIVFNVLFEYFRTNFLISVWQSGFIPGHSTVTHLVEMYDIFCKAVSQGKEIRVVFCDVSRAFDRVWNHWLFVCLAQ